MSKPIAILSAVRTPIGGLMGSLSSLSASDLGGIAIATAVEKSGLKASQVDEVIMGSVLTAGQGQAPARQAARAWSRKLRTPPAASTSRRRVLKRAARRR